MKYLVFLVIAIQISLKVVSQDFTFKEKKELSGYSDYIMDARFSPFRNYFAITIGNNTLEIYDKDWKKVFTHQGNPKSVGGQISFSPDEKFLAYAKYKSDNDIAIIRLEDKKVVQVLNGHAQNINKVEFSHNGKYLASTSSDNAVCIWLWKDEQLILLQKFIYDDSSVGVSFSYDDKYIVTGGYNKKVYLYQLKAEKYDLIDSIAVKYWQNDVCFHPSEYEFVTSSLYEVRRYNLDKQKIKLSDTLILYVNHKVKYNSTGEYLVFGKNQDVVILDMTKDKMRVFENIYRHGDYVFGGNFSDDGKFLTTFSSDKTCIVWELTGIEPSRKSLIAEYMSSELTSAQKIILTSGVIENILKNLDESLVLPRDEFETTIQFNDRKSKLKSEVLALLQFYTEKHYGIKSKVPGKVIIPVERVIG
ncbi:MAG: hypothetical protein A2X13_12905 [Bacteroidetes bacterium GWC2_33_15]|nr:MAG: hypothetical protein A2X10_13790 [Bacteroidetes bacterium GWA2_33_15]OFX50679.1 MAG: hypothetical protein A2X13_12905 [Bacteroidetes bacterium GWC2_33_15]OFX63225.1 MAG: hypothetical protein A2X15_01895 [Bacteroidetes bacterium GWB2_32_14]OFX69828.1 MAG: hypothetical protein A2X14_05580 [Bacteroidetes bacterium GWD2_33_33]HAN19873.1 hypothetical protein [Bacteroidales bacterium]